MKVFIRGKQGSRGRWRWQVLNQDDEKTVAMSPRDWPTRKEAEAVGLEVMTCMQPDVQIHAVDRLRALVFAAGAAFGALCMGGLLWYNM